MLAWLYVSQSCSTVIYGWRVFFGVWLGEVVEALLALEDQLDVEAVLEMIDPPVQERVR